MTCAVLMLLMIPAQAEEKKPEPRLLEVVDSGVPRDYENKRVVVTARRKVDNQGVTEHYVTISIFWQDAWISSKISKADLTDLQAFRKTVAAKLASTRKPDAVDTRLVYWYSADRTVSFSVTSDPAEWAIEKPVIVPIANMEKLLDTALSDLAELGKTTPVLPWK